MDYVSITGKYNYYEGYKQIVSGMSNKELYKTLTGKDYNITASSLRESEYINIKNLNPDKDYNDIKEEINEASKANRDVFEYCDEMDINFSNSYTSKRIAFDEAVSYRLGGNFWNENRETRMQMIANYYGDIGKRLDEAYAAGKFTKEEYDMLNKSIYEQMDKTISSVQATEAGDELKRKYYNLPPKKRQEVDERRKLMSTEEVQEEWKSEIAAYIERFCKNDRTNILELFNSIRYGSQKNEQIEANKVEA